MADPYVILTLKRYQALMKNPTSTNHSDFNVNSQVESAISNSKSYKRANSALLKQQLRKHGIKVYDNEDDLIRQCLGHSKKSIANESSFYDNLFKSNLEEWIKNPYILDKYSVNWYSLN